MSDTERLAQAIEALASAVRHQSQMTEVLVEAMPAAVEGRIPGISERTVRRNRTQRRNLRIMGVSA